MYQICKPKKFAITQCTKLTNLKSSLSLNVPKLAHKKVHFHTVYQNCKRKWFIKIHVPKLGTLTSPHFHIHILFSTLIKDIFLHVLFWRTFCTFSDQSKCTILFSISLKDILRFVLFWSMFCTFFDQSKCTIFFQFH